MIELTPLARPYAKAMFTSAVESNNIEDIASELKDMAIASKTEGVVNTIENPALSRQDILDILTNLFDESISDKSKKLLKSIEVLVATEPGNEAKDNIEQKLKSTYGKDAIINFTKDPTMMGGLSIKIGDETLDLSIRGKVKKLVNQLNF